MTLNEGVRKGLENTWRKDILRHSHRRVKSRFPSPLRALVGVIDQLPTEPLLQLLHAAEAALAMRADTKSDG